VVCEFFLALSPGRSLVAVILFFGLKPSSIDERVICELSDVLRRNFNVLEFVVDLIEARQSLFVFADKFLFGCLRRHWPEDFFALIKVVSALE
jgi:hypothetical protein